jgi:hypothetical protein
VAILRYAVLQVGHEWRVVCARRRIGHFASRAQAVQAGARLAREAVDSGHEVEFMVQDRTGLLLAQNFEPRYRPPPTPLIHSREALS